MNSSHRSTPIANVEALAQLPPPRRVAVVVNPIAVRCDEARAELIRQAEQADIELIELLTTRKNPGEQQTMQALNQDVDLIVVIGGDGTVRRVAGALAGHDVPLAVLPAGSGNVLARNLGLSPKRLADAVSAALTAPALGIDVGWARLTTDADGSDSEPLAEPFLVMAGIGRDAQAVQSTRAFLKRRWGWGAYAESGLRHALVEALPMRVSYDGAAPREVRSWTLLAGNLPYVPAGVQVFPEARIDDGRLQALEVPIEAPWQWAAIAVRGLGGAAPNARLRYVQAERIVVEPAEPQPVQLDGDIFNAVRRLELGVQASGIRLRIPTLG